jgi:transglutaminase-like putative cysteine protease
VIGDATTIAPSGATHAWVEGLLPGLGWAGFDPTNDVEAGDRHVPVAVGRDYADVPPTRGVYKGGAASTLMVAIVFERLSGTSAGEPPAKTVSRSFTPMSAPTAITQRRSVQQTQQQP